MQDVCAEDGLSLDETPQDDDQDNDQDDDQEDDSDDEASQETNEENSKLIYPKVSTTRIKLNAVFKSHEEFDNEFSKYKKDTYHVFYVANSAIVKGTEDLKFVHIFLCLCVAAISLFRLSVIEKLTLKNGNRLKSIQVDQLNSYN